MAVGVLLFDYRLVRSQAIVLVSVVCFLVHILLMPFRRVRTNILETVSLFALCCLAASQAGLGPSVAYNPVVTERAVYLFVAVPIIIFVCVWAVAKRIARAETRDQEEIQSLEQGMPTCSVSVRCLLAFCSPLSPLLLMTMSRGSCDSICVATGNSFHGRTRCPCHCIGNASTTSRGCRQSFQIQSIR